MLVKICNICRAIEPEDSGNATSPNPLSGVWANIEDPEADEMLDDEIDICPPCWVKIKAEMTRLAAEHQASKDSPANSLQN